MTLGPPETASRGGSFNLKPDTGLTNVADTSKWITSSTGNLGDTSFGRESSGIVVENLNHSASRNHDLVFKSRGIDSKCRGPEWEVVGRGGPRGGAGAGKASGEMKRALTNCLAARAASK
ncbi:hypothetical protein EVAR_28133_1 [Eumeta japonica]|uniref:Uncharacterized protein n=1 Tax=Eumeta variegata TaxID=151549 RepID=A0A4C1VEV3_EUMVA|nr:hypothetical protein EVAR_28133_1 [Eumeta japonica]